MYYGNPAYDGKRGGLQYQEYIQPEDLSWYQRTGTAIQNAIAAVRGHVYSLEQSFSLYEATGTFADTAYARPFGVRAFTFETGRSFQPEWPEAESVMQEGMAGLLQLCLLCLPTFEGAWEGTGTVTQGGMPRTAPFRFEFAPAALGGFSMAEYHNWQGNDLPSTPNNTGTPTPLNGQILIITFEASAPGWTTENRWSLRVDPVEEHIQFSVATTITPPPTEPIPVIQTTTEGVLTRAAQ